MNGPRSSALALRLRGNWEALDSGILLWRTNLDALLLYFALPFAALALLLRLPPEPWRYFSYLILWWFKPFFDRLVLHPVSIRFFEGGASRKRLGRGLGGALARGLPGDLLWRRASPWRAARLPIRVLERLSGPAARKRVNALERGGLGFGALQTILAFSLEWGLLLGEAIFVVMMVQMSRPEFLQQVWLYSDTIEALVYGAFCFNYVLLEPLYVCMGFGLYLNARLDSEGWDIELLFRSFVQAGDPSAEGSSSGGPKGATVLTTLALVSFLLLAPAQGARADEGPAEAVGTAPSGATAAATTDGLGGVEGAQKDAPLPLLDEVLASPDFGGETEGWGIRFKNRQERKDVEMPDLRPWMEVAKGYSAQVLRALLGLAILAAAGILLWRNRSRFRKGGTGTEGLGSASSRVLPQRRKDSAAALLERAEALFRDGRIREAWASCFTAATAAYAARGMPLPVDATEYECLAAVRSAGADPSGEFAAVVGAWIGFAYAGRVPGEEDFRRAADFCRALRAQAATVQASAAPSPASDDNETSSGAQDA